MHKTDAVRTRSGLGGDTTGLPKAPRQDKGKIIEVVWNLYGTCMEYVWNSYGTTPSQYPGSSLCPGAAEGEVSLRSGLSGVTNARVWGISLRFG